MGWRCRNAHLSRVDNWVRVQFNRWHMGFSTAAHLPANRGFNHSLTYLGGSETHFTQTSGSCPDAGPTVDLWDTHAPSNRNGSYGGYMYTDAAVQAIGVAADASVPLFLYFAAQNVHAPYEAPQRFLDLYSTCEWCTPSGKTVMAMVSAMDESLGNVTQALRDRNLWKSTLLIWSADNGGDGAKSGFLNHTLRLCRCPECRVTYQ